MMKGIQLIQLVMFVLLFNVGCDRALQFSSKDTTKPGINCVVDPQEFSVPTVVQQGLSFTMSFNRNNVFWELSGPSTSLQFQGSQVETSLDGIGHYIGSVYGTNNCNKEEAREFTIQVIEKIEGLNIVINNNDRYTRNQAVQLALSVQGATDMYVTNDPTCSAGGTWESFSATKAWNLGATNQLTRVYAKYKNSMAETVCISDDITHDNVAPLVRFVTAPAVLVSTKTANFEFAAEDTVSGVKALYCKLDSAAYAACPLTRVYTNLSEGSHSVSIYAEDNAGNVSNVETHTWSIDTTIPVVRITQAPSNPSTSKSATFAFDGTDGLVALTYFECSLDGAAYAVCSSPKNYTNLSEGSHTFSVKGKDAANNYSAPASYTWNIDSVRPSIVITQAPPTPTKDLNAHFAFTVTDAGLGIETIKCQLDAGLAVNCSDTMDYTALANGIHTFKVTATDKAGNSASASHIWEINDKITDQIIPVISSGGKVDVLFVMDNTSSMYKEYRDYVGYQFRNFLARLNNTDYKIGFITSDARVNSSPYSGGKLVPLEVIHPDTYVLTSASPHLGSSFIQTLARKEVTCAYGTWSGPNGSFCGVSGWNLPSASELIKATLQAFNRNTTFFRNDSSVNVVMVSDANEVCSSGMYGSNGLCLPADTEHHPQSIINYANQNFAGRFKTHALVWRNSDSCAFRDGSEKGRAYEYLAQQTGGVSRSICNDSASEGNAIADAIKSTANISYTLTCAPVDVNGDGVVNASDMTISYNPQPAQAPTVTVTGNQISFNPYLPAGTQVSLRYTCP